MNRLTYNQKQLSESTGRLVPLPPLLPLLPLLLLLLLLSLSFPPPARSQDTPKLTIDEDCPAFAFAPDGRIAYAVRRVITTKHLEMQRDDIWVTALDGRKKRIVNGEKIVNSPFPFSYAIHSLRWSPDGTRLTVEMLTSRMTNERGDTEEGSGTLLLEEDGKEIKIRGGDSFVSQATNAAWLADGVTLVFLTEAVKPKLLYSINAVRPMTGRGTRLFGEHAFVAVDWFAKQNAAVAIERDPSLSQPPKLVWLDLVKETRRELAELEGYIGHLLISPSGSKVAYFRDHETLEIRDMAQPDRPPWRVRMAFGSYQWAPDERRILLKRGPDRRSADLVWVSLPDGKLEPVLHALIFHDFELSPDGQSLAVTQPGKRKLTVYPVQ